MPLLIMGITLNIAACARRQPQPKALPDKAPSMVVIGNKRTKSCCTGKTPSRFGVHTITFGIK